MHALAISISRQRLLATRSNALVGPRYVSKMAARGNALQPRSHLRIPQPGAQQRARLLSEFAALKKERRMKRSADHLILGLVLANCTVFVGWQKVKRYPPMQRVMLNHFTTSTEHLDRGMYHTLLTSVFSHGDLGHLFANMVGLYFFGTPICARLGLRKFLGIYLGSGVVSSWAAVHEQKIADKLAFNFGASGAVNAVTVMNILQNPRSALLLFGVIPLPAWVAGSLFIGRDLHGWVTERQDGIGYFAHLSGAMCGTAAFGYLRFAKRVL